MKFDLRKAIQQVAEQVALKEVTEKMSSRDIENIIRKNKLKGSALPMFKVMGGKTVSYTHLTLPTTPYV